MELSFPTAQIERVSDLFFFEFDNEQEGLTLTAQRKNRSNVMQDRTFHNFRPQNPSMEVSELHKVLWLADFEAIQLWKFRSENNGHSLFPSCFNDDKSNNNLRKKFPLGEKWVFHGFTTRRLHLIHTKKFIYWLEKICFSVNCSNPSSGWRGKKAITKKRYWSKPSSHFPTW